MKTEALKWCLDKVGYDAPDTCDTEAAQKAFAAHGELKALEESHTAALHALKLQGYEDSTTKVWHTDVCHEFSRGGKCEAPCELARAALTKAGAI